MLDDAIVNRAAPPGSMRYFAVLYTPEAQRDLVTALFVIDAEIRESAQSANHDVAHTRLQWWRQEIERLVNANPQHPATRVLATHASIDKKAFAELHELIAAADMDLARMTYLNDQELRAYCSRSGGAVTQLIATMLAPQPLDDATLSAANRVGAFVRATEILRDARQDAYDGRLYIPLDEVERHAVKIEDLRAVDFGASARAALAALGDRLRAEFSPTLASIPRSMRAYLRPLFVLASLHAALLECLAARDYNVGPERIELGPVRKPWTAWRAARRAR